MPPCRQSHWRGIPDERDYSFIAYRSVGRLFRRAPGVKAARLNLVEAWFSILTRKSVRRGSFETIRALIRHIERYLAEWNAHPTPFVWTKEPAAIIKKALRRPSR